MTKPPRELGWFVVAEERDMTKSVEKLAKRRHGEPTPPLIQQQRGPTPRLGPQ